MDSIGPGDPEQAESTLEMIQRLYEEEGDHSPLPGERTGGLRFRQRVPDALLHMSRNNFSAVQRLSERIEHEKHRSVLAAGNLGGSGSRAALASLLYWHALDVPLWLIGESLGLEASRVRALPPRLTRLTPKKEHESREDGF